MKFRDYHLLSFLAEYEKKGGALDLCFSEYLRSHKAIGSNDRKAMGEALFTLIRYRSLFEALSPTWEGRLRLYQEHPIEDLTAHPRLTPWERFGIPKDLYDLHPDPTPFLGQAPIVIRANSLKTSREALAQILPFPTRPTEHSPWGLELLKREPLFSLPAFSQGLFEMQDEGSQMIAAFLKASPGQEILDYCAGSGGKALAIGALMQNRGQIFLHDIRKNALLEARKRFKRAGLQNGQFHHATLPSKRFDAVLADVPCTGTGTYRRNPDMKWRFSKPMLERLIEQQREIASQSIAYLKPGGRFLYATCSLLEQENQNQVQWLLDTQPLELEATLSTYSLGRMDALFGARFVRK